MATNVWSSSGSTDGNLASNWSLGALADTDVLTFDGTSVVNCTFTAAVNCAGVSIAVGYTGAFNDGGQAFTVSGAVGIASGGSFTASGTWTQDADADFTLTAATSWVTAGWQIDLQGTGNFKNNSGATRIIKKIAGAASGKTTTNTGSSTIQSVVWALGAGTWVNNSQINVACTSADDLDFNPLHTLIGNTAIYIRPTASITLTVPQVNAVGHITTFQLQNIGANDVIYSFQGPFTHGGRLYLVKTSTGQLTFNTNNCAFELKDVQCGSSNASSPLVVNAGSSVLSFSGYFETTTFNTGTTTLNLQTSTWTLAGDCDIGSNTTITPGTSLINFTGATAAILTSNSKTLGAITVNKSGNGVTLADPLTCGNLTLTSGNFDQDTFAISCANLVINSTGTLTFDGTTTVSGTGTYNQDVTFNRLVLTGDTTQTVAAAKTVTLTTYTATDMDGAAWASGTPGSAASIAAPVAGITVSNCKFTDITASSGAIDADNGTNDSGGGNTGIDFVGTLSVDPSSVSVGTTITVSDTGNAFSPATGMTVGGVAVDNFAITDKQNVTGDIGAGTTGSGLDVVVQTSDGNYTLAGAVVVAAAPPVISSLSPSSLPITGGELEINGEFEDYANTTVMVDGVSVPPTAANSTKITITAPAHVAGDVVVEVTDSYSQSDTEILTYESVPVPAASNGAQFFFFQ